MPANNRHTTGPAVLVLYGRNKALALETVEILRSLGCDASTLESLPGDGLSLDKKLLYYSKYIKLFVAIVTPANSRSKHPSQSLTTELATCLRDRPADTLLLLESGTKLAAMLPPQAHEEYPKGEFHRALIPLIKNLRRRGLISTEGMASRELLEARREYMVGFINEMDAIWDSSDAAWTPVFKQDIQTEARISVLRDEFFVEYYSGFRALFDPEASEDDVKQALGVHVRKAEDLAVGVFDAALALLETTAAGRVASQQRQKRLSYGRKQELGNAKKTHEEYRHATTFSRKKELAMVTIAEYTSFLDAN